MSICIPAYDMGGQGGAFLAEGLAHLTQQDFTSFEVVVADQSEDQSAVPDAGPLSVAKACRQFQDRLSLRHLDSRTGLRQASDNTNFAMTAATGEIVKILFQDDLIAAPTALSQIAAAFDDPTCKWSLCGSAVTRDGLTSDRPMVPRLNPQIRYGRNTVSSPSVLAMRRSQALEFDTQLIWLMDVELYHRLTKTHGAPAILPEPLIWNRLHEGQVSSGVTPELRRSELQYVRQKHGAGETLKDRLAFYKQVLKAR